MPSRLVTNAADQDAGDAGNAVNDMGATQWRDSHGDAWHVLEKHSLLERILTEVGANMWSILCAGRRKDVDREWTRRMFVQLQQKQDWKAAGSMKAALFRAMCSVVP